MADEPVRTVIHDLLVLLCADCHREETPEGKDGPLPHDYADNDEDDAGIEKPGWQHCGSIHSKKKFNYD